MNIDELEWPDDAEFYGPETDGYFAGFYKRDGDSWFFVRAGLRTWIEEVDIPNKLIARPTPAWKDGIPPAGVECEYTPRELGNWKSCTVIGRHKGFVWLQTGIAPFTALSNEIKFRPLQLTLREKALSVVHAAMDTTYIDGGKVAAITDAAASFYAAAAVDALLEKFDLTEKTK